MEVWRVWTRYFLFYIPNVTSKKLGLDPLHTLHTLHTYSFSFSREKERKNKGVAGWLGGQE
jgi:hypothetical protein